MARADYYLVLGVPRDETPERIRTAYRALVKRYHPDRAGAADAARFREVAEAYEVLSDGERRRRYNALLERAAPVGRRVAPAPWPEPEPLAAHDAPVFAEPMSVRRAATGVGTPKGGRVDTLHVEVVLAPDEALRGGMLAVAVPVPGWCPACGGGGETWSGRCRACGGEGVVEREVPVRVRLPVLVRDATLELPLHDVGLPDVVLALHLRIAPWSTIG